MHHCPHCRTALTHGVAAHDVITDYCPACAHRDRRHCHAAVADVSTALDDLACQAQSPGQPWPATEAAILHLVATLDAYTLSLLRAGAIGAAEAAVYQAWRAGELAQLAAIRERAALHELLADVDMEG
jgi:hypothetical protein